MVEGCVLREPPLVRKFATSLFLMITVLLCVLGPEACKGRVEYEDETDELALVTALQSGRGGWMFYPDGRCR